MARDYRVYVHFEVLEILPQKGKRRSAVVSYLRILGRIAHLGGDYVREDPETGRPFEVTEVAGFAVTWWIDAPADEVKIVDIHPCSTRR